MSGMEHSGISITFDTDSYVITGIGFKAADRLEEGFSENWPKIGPNDHIDEDATATE